MKRIILHSKLIVVVMFTILSACPVPDATAALSPDQIDAFKAQITAAGDDADQVIKLVREMVAKHPDDAAEIAALAAEIVPELAVDIAVAAAEMALFLAEEIIEAVSAVVPDQAAQIRHAVEALLEAKDFSPTPILDEPQEIPAPPDLMPPPVTAPPTTEPYGQ